MPAPITTRWPVMSSPRGAIGARLRLARQDRRDPGAQRRALCDAQVHRLERLRKRAWAARQARRARLEERAHLLARRGVALTRSGVDEIERGVLGQARRDRVVVRADRLERE